MAFCKTCKSEIHDKDSICPKCKAVQKNTVFPDKSSFLWGLLGFFTPPFLLNLLYKNTKPKKAKAIEIGAFVSFGAGILFLIIRTLIAK